MPADVSSLESRTEGWIAALQLAAASLHGRDDKTAFISGFAGDDRFVVDYLADEVLDRQPAALRRFLLETSVLERLSGPLCDAVTDQKGRRVDVGRAGAEEPAHRAAGRPSAAGTGTTTCSRMSFVPGCSPRRPST